MKNIFSLIGIIFSLIISVSSGLTQTTGRNFYFQENNGQIMDQNFNTRNDILFSTNRDGLQIFMKADGMHYQLSEILDERTSFYRTDISWIGANPDIEIIKGSESGDYVNYYNVAKNTEPALYVRSYESITYKNIYDDIDLIFYSKKDGNMKYDFVVKPFADFKKIKIKIKGAELLLNDNNELFINTPLGRIIEGKILCYQDNRDIDCKWILENDVLSFEIADYDNTLPLIIDPPVRLWATYYGGSGNELVSSVSIDGDGNFYMAGTTWATNNIATIGAHQYLHGGGLQDAFLLKMDSLGNRLWATYYGGSNSDYGTCCKTDHLNNIFLVGYTRSANNIATTNAYQPTLGGYHDAFIAKFNSDGIRIWGTYYGGSQDDNPYGCALDNTGNIFIAGATSSTDLISYSGAHQHIYGGGLRDAFIAKFNNNGVLLWDTYLGGSLEDMAYSCASDATNNIYVAGRTKSLNGISSQGAHQDSLNGLSDAFLVKFNANGERQWGTYYGGTNAEEGRSCATDIFGNVYLAGSTTSTTHIATAGAYQTTMGSIDWDGFLVKFDPNGIRQWGTYYGGEDLDHGEDCTTDIYGNVYLVGSTKSKQNMVSPGAYQETYSGGSYDAFLVKFDPLGNRFWGTYYGGEGVDKGYAVAACGTDRVYIAGITYSANNIASSGAHQPNHSLGGGGSSDGFIVKFSNDTTAHIFTPSFSSPLNFIAYPSPGSGLVNIELDKNYTNISIRVYSVLGQLIFTEFIPSAQNFSLELQNVRGLYFLEIGTEYHRSVKKIIIEK